MFCEPTRSRARLHLSHPAVLRSGCAWAFLAFACLTPTPAAAQQDAIAERAKRSPAFLLAVEQLSALEKSDQDLEPGQLDRTRLLARNLSRYFIRYAVPEQSTDLQRLLGTLQRTTRDAGRLFLGAALSLASAEGATEIGERHLRPVTDALLPYQVTPQGDRLYFAETGASAVLLERWDLEALNNTGMVWEVVGGLAESAIAPSVLNGSGLDVDSGAAELLADTLNAYGLLVFRLSGEIARSGLEEAVATRHLRDAVKVLRARADGQLASIKNTYSPRRGPHQQAGKPLFQDVTDAAGIRFRHTSSDWIARFRRFGHVAPTFSGGGAAAGDVNGDRWPDLVLCGGHGCSLLINDAGVFKDRTEAAGITLDAEARMPILADLDNDGDLDLFVTYARDPNRLFVNDGDGSFTLLESTGLETVGDISGPAAAVDLDNDGYLDLYVGNFGHYLSGASAWVARDATNALPNRLYRNLGTRSGGLRFEDITEHAGVGDTGWAQALSHFDVDRDGDQDLYIANDFGRNQLLLNRGDATFEKVAQQAGTDDAFHGMNVSFADLNRDGFGDIFITNIWFWAATKGEITETNTLLLSDADSLETSGSIHYTKSTAGFLEENDSGWAWAALFFDVENDGDDDLFVANGFTDYMTFAQYRPHPDHPDKLFAINNGREKNLLFLDNSSREEPGLPSTLRTSSGLEMANTNSRSAVLLDFDRDGDLDVLVTTFHDSARLFRNDAPRSGQMLQVELIGDLERKTNRNAIGAQLQLTLSDGRKVWRTITGGEGYLGMSDLPVEFGTAGAPPISLEILWPNGDIQTIEGLPEKGLVIVQQGKPQVLVPPPAQPSSGL